MKQLVVNYFITLNYGYKEMDLQDIEKIDSKNMFKVYDRWPDIAKESYEQEFSKPEFSNIDNIISNFYSIGVRRFYSSLKRYFRTVPIIE